MAKKKVVFVTGGSGGIGKSICLKLIRSGFNVAVGYKTNIFAISFQNFFSCTQILDTIIIKCPIVMNSKSNINLIIKNTKVIKIGYLLDLRTSYLTCVKLIY